MLLGSYRLIRTLDDFRDLAEDTRFGRLVVLNRIPDAWVDDESRRARLTRAARAASTFSHPEVAALYALEDLAGRWYLVSEHVEGPSLREALQLNRLPPEEVVDIRRRVLDALEAAHRHGLQHPGLSLDHIVRTPDGRVKILGFGGIPDAGEPHDHRDVATMFRELEAGVPPDTTTPAAPPRTADGDSGFFSPRWWWQCHQLVTSLAYGMVVYFLWIGRSWQPDAVAQWLVIVGAAGALTANTTRLHVWLTSYLSPTDWDQQRQRVWGAMRLGDGALGVTLLLSAARLSGPYPERSALFLGSAVVVLVGFTLIEPTLTRAVVRRQAS